MIHHEIANTIRRDRSIDDFLTPYYEAYSIAEFVPTILSTFNVSHNRKEFHRDIQLSHRDRRIKLVLLTDGLGYDHFIKYHHRFPFFAQFAKKGEVYPLTSVFPSTTSAAITTIHTGLTPQEHGLPEWNVYFEEFDSIIQTLPFRSMDSSETDSLLKSGGTAEMLYDGPTVYEELRKKNIPSYVLMSDQYAGTAYSRKVHKGAELVPFQDEVHCMVLLRDLLEREKGEAYVFVYWSKIDGTAHQFGPETPQHIESIHEFDRCAREECFRHLSAETARDIVTFFLADHGHVNINRENIINLNKYEIIEDSFVVSKKGKRILPTGSPHDVFLFIQPEKIAIVTQSLQEELAGKAAVFSAEEAFRLGLFGINEPTEKFKRRIGNLVILPHAGFHVWYQFIEDELFHHFGIHGGLSEAEMLVPFGVIATEDLVEAK